MLFASIFIDRSPHYYQYNDTTYVSYNDTWYEYDYDQDNDLYDYYPINQDALPVQIQNNPVDYEYNWNDVEHTWQDIEFEDSTYYRTNIESDYTDDGYDWDSSDSWDSGSTDWGSDW